MTLVPVGLHRSAHPVCSFRWQGAGRHGIRERVGARAGLLLPLLLSALLGGCGSLPVPGNGAAPTGDAAAQEGSLDLADCRRIAGWAWTHTQPDMPLQVEI